MAQVDLKARTGYVVIRVSSRLLSKSKYCCFLMIYNIQILESRARKGEKKKWSVTSDKVNVIQAIFVLVEGR